MTDPASERNRRRHERRAVRLMARLESSVRGNVSGHVVNIGAGGAFFITDDLETLLAENSEVTLYVEGDTPLAGGIAGTILRIDTDFEDDHIVRSLAVRFVSPLPPKRMKADES